MTVVAANADLGNLVTDKRADMYTARCATEEVIPLTKTKAQLERDKRRAELAATTGTSRGCWL